MSDFLKNLRSSQKKDPAGVRKSPGNHYYPEHDRRMNWDRRPGPGPGYQDPMSTGPDMMPEILEHLTNLSDQIERLVTSNERLVEVKVYQHQVMAEFFTTLNAWLTNSMTAAKSDEAPAKVTTSYASGTHYTKDEVLEMIQDLRTEGATFSHIASTLKEKGIPTFSGKGDWHAQTIHRLCK